MKYSNFNHLTSILFAITTTSTVDAFSLVRVRVTSISIPTTRTTSSLFSTPSDDDKAESNEEGMSLAADFFKTIQSRNIQLDDDDLLDDDDDEDDDDDDEEENENSDEDSGGDGDGDVENVSDVTLSDDQVYSELNERVLETAGGFVDLVSKASDDDDDDDDDESSKITKPKVYEPPKTIPDPALTAGEVVTTVLEALNHNDVPSADYGVQVLFGYSSAGSAISQAIDVEGMTPAEYATFLKEEYEYAILFNHGEVMIEKGDYSFDRKKAFFTARLSSVVDPLDCTNVNFILSTDGQGEDDCWLIDSLLIRPEGMRRRRRR